MQKWHFKIVRLKNSSQSLKSLLSLCQFPKREGTNQNCKNMWSFPMAHSKVRNVIFMYAKHFYRKTAWQTKVVFLGLPNHNSKDWMNCCMFCPCRRKTQRAISNQKPNSALWKNAILNDFCMLCVSNWCCRESAEFFRSWIPVHCGIN